MKRKIIFGSIAILFAAAAVFNINLLQNKNADDISLDAITIMAQAHDGETGGGGHANICDPIWNVTYEGELGTGNIGAKVICSTDGNYICPICFWK